MHEMHEREGTVGLACRTCMRPAGRREGGGKKQRDIKDGIYRLATGFCIMQTVGIEF